MADFRNLFRRRTPSPAVMDAPLKVSSPIPPVEKTGTVQSKPALPENMQAAKLLQQIGSYVPEKPDTQTSSTQQQLDSQFVATRLDGKGVKELHQGILEYKLGYDQKVADYQNKHSELDSEDIDPNRSINNRQYFREQFALYIAQINAGTEGRYQGAESLRKTNPELATVSMEEFLGPEGTELYHLALEEEMNSTEYRNAVFRASTTHYEGEKWAERPAVFVAGPSGSGKTFAAQAAVAKANEFLPKVTGNNSGNDVVAADGGVVREVSQMRKLVIQASNNKGYTGVKDLHNQSHVLEGVKGRVLDAALATPSLGVVIPETFSDYISPTSKSRKLLHKVQEQENTKTIFCQVEGMKENPSLFQRVVGFMGSRRAWKTDGFEKQKELDLNNTKIAESKAYGAGGFKFGEFGSNAARKDYEKTNPDNLSMIITNDLLLKKESPPGSHQWIDANQGEEGTILVSNRVFKLWEEKQARLSPEQRKNQTETLVNFRDQLKTPPLVRTSCEMALVSAHALVDKALQTAQTDVNKAKEKYGEFHPSVSAVQGKADRLQVVSLALKNLNVEDKNQVDMTKAVIMNQILLMQRNGDFSRLYSNTKRSLECSVAALEKISNDLEKQADLKHTPVSHDPQAGVPASEQNCNKFKANLHRAKEEGDKPHYSDDNKEAAVPIKIQL